MKNRGGVQYNRWSGAGASRGQAGFTLVEVLVVLAILVILFSLLFAPMIASMDMVTLGQSRVRMQDAARTAMEQIRREIGNAMYVYPTPIIRLAGADGTLGTGDDRRIPNYSAVVFVPPARRNGRVVDPPAPRTDSLGNIIATRFRVALADEAYAYSDSNPFVLVREEGYYTYNAVLHNYVFTPLNPANPTRNIITPRSGYDIPVTTSICKTCGRMVAGYITTCTDTSCGSTDIAYLHGNLQFRPERITAEMLKPSNDATLYRARHGAWDGFDNDGTWLLQDIVGAGSPATLGFNELDPRIVVYRSTDMYVRRDSYSTVDYSNIFLTWNSSAGAVQVGAATRRRVSVTSDLDAGDSVPVGSYYALDCAGDAYDSTGTRSGAQSSDLVPVYPVSAVAGDPAMPIAYIIDPTMGGAEPRAKIVPGSVKVRVVAQDDASGRWYQATYTETTNTNQDEIGRRQFAVVLSDYNQRGEVRFNERRPPSPRFFDADGDGALDRDLRSFYVYIEYYFRRNYDAANPQNDDIIKVDYSTRDVMNVTLTLQRYFDPEPDPNNSDVLIIPADATLDRVSVQDQIQVRNMGR
ncbi:MAG: type II secretion system protein [Armatimonadetes bacterium]|nr:type II secretion system protein [Armatimonadota bacterium]